MSKKPVKIVPKNTKYSEVNRNDQHKTDDGATVINVSNGKVQDIKVLENLVPDNASLAAKVTNVYYTYNKPSKKNFILNGINISVRKGEIYALLGPSGCGKTTLLKCITGLQTPYKGEIWLSPTPSCKNTISSIGFMPQELSLFPELTIQETLWLFGRICGISSSNLKYRIAKYSEIFDIPPKIRRICNLSGGQKRRVSFVAALLRDAPLLCLDEPTVGLDPILRQTIWKYLIELTSQHHKTVLLTTHYIDEAKDASNIGLMRDGKILTEASPSDLMLQLGEASLEQCFYKICVKSENTTAAETCSKHDPERQSLLENDVCAIEMNNSNLTRKSFRQKLSSKMLKPIKFRPACDKFVSELSGCCRFQRYDLVNTICLMQKNIRVLQRSWIMLFMQFLLPAVTVALFGICIGEDIQGLKIAIVNSEDPKYLSLNFLKELDGYDVILQDYNNLEEGIAKVRNGEAIGAVYFNPDFSYCLLHRLNLGVWVNNATLECSTIKLYMDTTNQILSLSFQHYLFTAFQKFERNVLISLESNPSIANLPVEFQNPPIYGRIKMKYSEYISPTVLLICIHYLAAAYTGLGLIIEQENGVFERLQISGVSKAQIFASQLLTNLLVVLGQISLMLIVQLNAFDYELKGNVIHIIILVILQGICGIMFGFFIAASTSSVNTGVMIGLGVMYPNLVTCGFIWPLEGMPVFIRKIAYFVPMTLNTYAIRSVFSKGWGLDNMVVVYGFLSVIAWCAVFLIVGIIIYRIRKG